MPDRGDRAGAQAPRKIDPRNPRFAAGITSVLLLVVVFLALTGLSTAHGVAASGWFAYAPHADASHAGMGWVILSATPLQRALDPAFLLLLVAAIVFLWSIVSPSTAPWGALYRWLVAPRLAPPTELEDPRPLRFAQGVGLCVAIVGLVLHLIGVPWALPIAAAAAFVAACLNAVFGFCIGCELYLVLQRAGITGRAQPSSA